MKNQEIFLTPVQFSLYKAPINSFTRIGDVVIKRRCGTNTLLIGQREVMIQNYRGSWLYRLLTPVLGKDAEIAKVTKPAPRFYAVRLGFGSEGHGEPIVIASADSIKEVDARAQRELQDEFGGLWTSKYADTYVGSVTFLRHRFPEQVSGSLDRALNEFDAQPDSVK